MQASDTHADIYIMMLTVSPIKLCICSSRVFINPFIKVDILSFFFYVKTYKLETKASFLRPQGEEWVTNNLTGRHSRYHLHNKKKWKWYFITKIVLTYCDKKLLPQWDLVVVFRQTEILIYKYVHRNVDGLPDMIYEG